MYTRCPNGIAWVVQRTLHKMACKTLTAESTGTRQSAENIWCINDLVVYGSHKFQVDEGLARLYEEAIGLRLTVARSLLVYVNQLLAPEIALLRERQNFRCALRQKTQESRLSCMGDQTTSSIVSRNHFHPVRFQGNSNGNVWDTRHMAIFSRYYRTLRNRIASKLPFFKEH